VASRKRGEAVLGFLADRGVPAEMLDSIRVPVGLDLGHTSHNEIAVSVLAELVALRAKGELGGAVAVQSMTSAGPELAVDLVCAMTVPADDTSRPLEHEGTTYYFCSPGCRVAFAKDPEKYIAEGVA
jgi:xanthine dehydrogenase accessory factor